MRLPKNIFNATVVPQHIKEVETQHNYSPNLAYYMIKLREQLVTQVVKKFSSSMEPEES
jgi:hypothetical protein